MAAIPTATVPGAAGLRFDSGRRPTPAGGNGIAVDFFSGDPSKSTWRTTVRRSVQVLASNPNGEVNSSGDASSSFKEELSYLWKLGAGSVAGAAAVKYGSIIFPEVTRPNILQALTMISTPMIVAVFLLIKQSREAE